MDHLPKGYWEGPSQEVFAAGRRSGLRVVYVRIHPNVVFIPDVGPLADEAAERRLFRRMHVFGLRLERDLGIEAVLHNRELVGPYTACFFGYPNSCSKYNRISALQSNLRGVFSAPSDRICRLTNPYEPPLRRRLGPKATGGRGIASKV